MTTLKMTTHQIRLEPEGRIIAAKDGQSIYEALVRAGILINAPCGGDGRCAQCRVQIDHAIPTGITQPKESTQGGLSPSDIRAGWRLACMTTVNSDMVITLPSSSMATLEPAAKSDVVSLLSSHKLPPLSDAGKIPYGVAVDLGTTTIGVYLCDLRHRQIIRSMALRNPQVILGVDVLRRLSAVGKNTENLKRLKALAINAIDGAVFFLCRSAQIDCTAVSQVVVVGNSVMLHIFHGVDPSPIGVKPFRPVFTKYRHRTADFLGFKFNPLARVFTPPLMSGFLGGDILSAAFATKLIELPPGSLLVDLGTNGELMLRAKDAIYATACATGPAFEGGSIQCGMQALPGAIDRVSIKPDKSVCYAVIPKTTNGKKTKPIGLCGSGLVAAAAAMLRTGTIGRDGAYNTSGGYPRIVKDDSGQSVFVVATAEEASSSRAITISQKDIRSLQLAKGAISAGIQSLCAAAGNRAVSDVLIAGAFGNNLDIDDVRTIGFFPRRASLRTIGNAAGAGAILALFDQNVAEKLSGIVARTHVLNLGGDLNFQKAFVKALAFSKDCPGQ
jgi:uncharacterized 2Fe-2S/4Fe-4S cluster protein (DUF4445 family)